MVAQADHVVPSARLAGKAADAGGGRIAREGVQDQNGVGFGRVQRAISLVRDAHRREARAILERDGIELRSEGFNCRTSGAS